MEINSCGYTYWSIGMGDIRQSMIADQWRLPLGQNTDHNGFAYVMLGIEKTKGTKKPGPRATHFNEGVLFKKKSKNEHKEFLTTCSVGTPTHFMECWRSAQ